MSMEVSLQKDQTRLQFSTPSEFSNFIGHKLENASLVCCNALQELGRCCSIIPNGLLTSLYYDQNVLFGLVTVYRVQLFSFFFSFGLLLPLLLRSHNLQSQRSC